MHLNKIGFKWLQVGKVSGRFFRSAFFLHNAGATSLACLLTCMEWQNDECWMLADNISHVRLYENENIFMYVRPSDTRSVGHNVSL